MKAEPPYDRVVLITGAAGGLGRELVQTFAGQGWRVAAGFHRRPASFAETIERVWPVPVDVTSADQIQESVRQILERWQRIDVLIHNAGLTADHLSWQIPDDDWARVLEVNLKGAFLCARAVFPAMIRQRDGHIIHISSWSGRSGQRGQANYAAAKAGLFGLTTALAREAGSRDVRVNAILPGVLPTPMTARLEPAALEQLAAANVLGRLNTLDEVARFTVFLAGMRNVSGQIFQLDSRIAPWS